MKYLGAKGKEKNTSYQVYGSVRVKVQETIKKISEEAILVEFAIKNDILSLDMDPEEIKYEDLQKFYRDNLGPYKIKVLFTYYSSLRLVFSLKQ